MPNIETPDELAEDIANLCGVYGACAQILGEACAGKCRPHFVSEMTARIRQSVENEKMLDRGAALDGQKGEQGNG